MEIPTWTVILDLSCERIEHVPPLVYTNRRHWLSLSIILTEYSFYVVQFKLLLGINVVYKQDLKSNLEN